MINFSVRDKTTNARRNERQVHVVDPEHFKTTATVMLTCSRYGKKKPATIVFKSTKSKKKPNSVYLSSLLMKRLNLPANVNVMASPSGWMNRHVLHKWHENTFASDDRSLLLDRAGAHCCTDFINSLEQKHKDSLLFIPANCTDELQPLDISVMSIFKQRYKQYMKENNLPQLKSKLSSFRQHVVNAVSWSWNSIEKETIYKGFMRAGFEISNPPRIEE